MTTAIAKPVLFLEPNCPSPTPLPPHFTYPLPLSQPRSTLHYPLVPPVLKPNMIDCDLYPTFLSKIHGTFKVMHTQKKQSNAKLGTKYRW